MTITQSKAPAIPSVPQTAPADLSMFLNAVKSAIDVMAGDSDASGVTLEQLNEILRQYTITGGAAFGGIVDRGTEGGALTPTPPPDTTTPPAPSGLTTAGGLSTVILEWNPVPSSPPIAFTTIYRAAVDNFSVSEPVGTTNVLIYSDFVPDIDTYYYWIRFTSEAGIEGPVNQTAGTPGASDPDATGKIVVSALSALAANLGSVTAGELRSPDSTFLVDLTNKEILITGPNGQVADDYTIIRNGQIEAWFWTGSTHVLAGALRGIQSGVADNGQTITIPGYFRKQPNIVVTPANIPTYLAANSAQDQALQCAAENVVETFLGSGQWQFRAIARLVASGGTDIQSPGLSFSNSPLDDIYLSSVTTTSSSVTEIGGRTSVRTFRSTGTAGVYFNRSVQVYLEYRIAGSGDPYTIVGPVTQQINQESTYVAINFNSGPLPANQYQTRLRYIFTNTPGTYTGSGGGTEPAPTVVVNGSPVDQTRSSDGTFFGTINTGAWVPPPGATNISVVYEYSYTATCTVSYLFNNGPNTSTVSGLGGTTQTLATATIDASNPETNPKTVVQNGSYSASGAGSYNPNFLSWRIVNSSQSDGSASGRIQAINVKATIDYNQPIPTDTNPHNYATWDTLVTTLTGSTVLSDGTVNWQAIGES